MMKMSKQFYLSKQFYRGDAIYSIHDRKGKVCFGSFPDREEAKKVVRDLNCQSDLMTGRAKQVGAPRQFKVVRGVDHPKGPGRFDYVHDLADIPRTDAA